MNAIQKRFLLFLLGCIPARLLYTYLAKTHLKYLKYFGLLALAIGCSFMYLYFTNSRKTGAEVFGDKIWWKEYRIIHGSLFLLFAYLSLVNKSKHAWKVLLVDTIIGLGLFLGYHHNQGNFKQLY